jgi:hypothetical protein
VASVPRLLIAALVAALLLVTLGWRAFAGGLVGVALGSALATRPDRADRRR